MLDDYGREINYLRLSVTDKCNLACSYCKPRPVKKLLHGDLLSIEEMTDIVRVCRGLGINKVRITGGEPLLRRGIVKLVENVVNSECKAVMTTNATKLTGFAPELKSAGLSRLNVSLDTLDEKTYKTIAKGELKEALEGIDAALKYRFPLKINAVLQKGLTDDILPLCKFAKGLGAELRFIELMPFAFTKDYFSQRFLSSKSLIERYGMVFVGNCGNVENYEFDGFQVGFISPISNKFCEVCDRIRVTSTGYILPCLHGENKYYLRPFLGDNASLKAFVADCIRKKPSCHALEKGKLQSEDMGSIGG